MNNNTMPTCRKRVHRGFPLSISFSKTAKPQLSINPNQVNFPSSLHLTHLPPLHHSSHPISLSLSLSPLYEEKATIASSKASPICPLITGANPLNGSSNFSATVLPKLALNCFCLCKLFNTNFCTPKIPRIAFLKTGSRRWRLSKREKILGWKSRTAAATVKESSAFSGAEVAATEVAEMREEEMASVCFWILRAWRPLRRGFGAKALRVLLRVTTCFVDFQLASWVGEKVLMGIGLDGVFAYIVGDLGDCCCDGGGVTFDDAVDWGGDD